MRLLVTLLFDTLTALSNVCIIVVFVYFVFGITALQLWAGVLRHRCFLDSEILEQYSFSESTFHSGFGIGGSIGISSGSREITSPIDKFITDEDLLILSSGEGSGTGAIDPKDLGNLTDIYATVPEFYMSESKSDIICGGQFQCSRDVPEWE